MKKIRCIILIFLVTTKFVNLSAQSLSPADSLAFVQRCNVVFSQYDVLNPTYLNTCTVKQAGYLIGVMVAKHSPTNDINTFANRLIQKGHEQAIIANRGFDYAPMMDAYVRFNSYFTDQTKTAFKQFFSTESCYKTPGTYNETLMLATARFLVGQVWGESNLPDSTAFRTDDRNAKNYLKTAMSTVVYSGMGEFGSNPYAPFSMACFLSLADLSTDLEIKRMATITYESVLAQSIAPSLKGNYIAAAGRNYPDVWLGDTKGTVLMSYLWSYIGLGGAPVSNNYIYCLPCFSNYRLPNNLYQIAINRGVKQVVKTNFQNRFQYSYLNKNYGIYSQRELSNKIYGQLQHSGVLWVNSDETKGNVLWVTNPMWDSLAMVQTRHTHGMSTFEKVSQFNGTTVHSYNIPTAAMQSDGKVQVQINKYALGWIPGSYVAKINDSSTSGRIFLHYGKVLIAISASNKFNWNPLVAPSTYKSITDIKTGDSQFHVEGLQFGLAIETADPAEYTGTIQAQLDSFKADVLKNSISYDSKSLTTSYIDRSGNVITCAFNGGDKINNTLIAYDNTWGIINCDGMFQLPGSNLTITYGNQKTIYDFVNWKISNIITDLNANISNSEMKVFVDGDDYLNIRFNYNTDEIALLEIYALDGTCLYKQKIVKSTSTLKSNLAGFRKGIYICRLTTNQGYFASKFTK